MIVLWSVALSEYELGRVPIAPRFAEGTFGGVVEVIVFEAADAGIRENVTRLVSKQGEKMPTLVTVGNSADYSVGIRRGG